MKERVFRSIVLAIFASALAFPVGAQVYQYNDGRKLQIEFVQEPPCPVKISVKRVELNREPDAQLIYLNIENLSSKPIRAYAMVSGGNRHPNMHTSTFGAAPFEPGQTLTRAMA